jgi:adenosylmethionine-8-amino-7-oxononanoate aminotransferase
MSAAAEMIDRLCLKLTDVRLWYVTGTYHGSHIYARSEGDARRAFHRYYNGESIVHIRDSEKPRTRAEIKELFEP